MLEVPSAGFTSARLFVSSTFLDMQAERDVLVKRVFPELRRRFYSRQISLTEVDLRWGITRSEIDEGRLLPICLAEIDRCHPFFLCVLGERYGWIPDVLPESLCREHPWVFDYRGASVTELEIRYALRQKHTWPSAAYYYLRVSGLGPSTSIDTNDLRVESGTAALRLRRLKEDIHKTGLPVREYDTIEGFEQMVLVDLTASLNALVPAESDPHPLAHESHMHDAFASSAAKAIVPLPGSLERLSSHVTASDAPLVVTGEAGSGKSALLGAWYDAHRGRTHIPISRWIAWWQRTRNPQVAYERSSERGWQEPLCVIAHFVGATSASTDWESVVYRLVSELVRRCSLDFEVPIRSSALRSVLFRALAEANNKARVVILLDGIDHLETPPKGERVLGWLPEQVPARVRLMISARPGPFLNALLARGWQELALSWLSPSQRRAIATRYLDEFRKRLEPEWLETLTDAETCANPLYLRTCLEELRMFGVYETLPQRIDRQLQASDAKRLFQMVYERCEQDFESARSGLVRDSLSLVALTRIGLAENELRELLGTGGAPLPSALWSPLVLSLSSALMERSGLITFAHPYAREAVHELYLQSADIRTGRIQALVKWLRRAAPLDRKVQELPWHLMTLKDWPGMCDLLACPEFVGRAFAVARLEVLNWWRELERNSAYRAQNVYAPVVAAPEVFGRDVGALALLLRDLGHFDDASSLGSWLIRTYRRSGDLIELESWLERQSVALRELGRHKEALDLLRETESLCLGRIDALRRCLGNQAILLRELGRHTESMAMHRREEAHCQTAGDEHGRAFSLLNQAKLQREAKRFDEAENLLVEAERVLRRACDWYGVQRALGGLADVSCKRGRFREARRRSERQERICRELGDPDALQRCLAARANVLQFDQDFDGALEVLLEHEELCRATGNIAGLARGKAMQAMMYGNLRWPREARSVAREAFQLAVESRDRELARELADDLATWLEDSAN